MKMLTLVQTYTCIYTYMKMQTLIQTFIHIHIHIQIYIYIKMQTLIQTYLAHIPESSMFTLNAVFALDAYSQNSVP